MEIACTGSDDSGAPVHLTAHWIPGESLSKIKADGEDFEGGHFAAGDKKIKSSNKEFEKRRSVDAFALDPEAANLVVLLPKVKPEARSFSARMGEAEETDITYELTCTAE